MESAAQAKDGGDLSHAATTSHADTSMVPSSGDSKSDSTNVENACVGKTDIVSDATKPAKIESQTSSKDGGDTNISNATTTSYLDPSLVPSNADSETVSGKVSNTSVKTDSVSDAAETALIESQTQSRDGEEIYENTTISHADLGLQAQKQSETGQSETDSHNTPVSKTGIVSDSEIVPQTGTTVISSSGDKLASEKDLRNIGNVSNDKPETNRTSETFSENMDISTNCDENKSEKETNAGNINNELIDKALIVPNTDEAQCENVPEKMDVSPILTPSIVDKREIETKSGNIVSKAETVTEDTQCENVSEMVDVSSILMPSNGDKLDLETCSGDIDKTPVSEIVNVSDAVTMSEADSSNTNKLALKTDSKNIDNTAVGKTDIQETQCENVSENVDISQSSSGNERGQLDNAASDSDSHKNQAALTEPAPEEDHAEETSATVTKDDPILVQKSSAESTCEKDSVKSETKNFESSECSHLDEESRIISLSESENLPMSPDDRDEDVDHHSGKYEDGTVVTDSEENSKDLANFTEDDNHDISSEDQDGAILADSKENNKDLESITEDDNHDHSSKNQEVFVCTDSEDNAKDPSVGVFEKVNTVDLSNLPTETDSVSCSGNETNPSSSPQGKNNTTDLEMSPEDDDCTQSHKNKNDSSVGVSEGDATVGLFDLPKGSDTVPCFGNETNSSNLPQVKDSDAVPENLAEDAHYTLHFHKHDKDSVFAASEKVYSADLSDSPKGQDASSSSKDEVNSKSLPLEKESSSEPENLAKDIDHTDHSHKDDVNVSVSEQKYSSESSDPDTDAYSKDKISSSNLAQEKESTAELENPSEDMSYIHLSHKDEDDSLVAAPTIDTSAEHATPQQDSDSDITKDDENMSVKEASERLNAMNQINQTQEDNKLNDNSVKNEEVGVVAASTNLTKDSNPNNISVENHERSLVSASANNCVTIQFDSSKDVDTENEIISINVASEEDQDQPNNTSDNDNVQHSGVDQESNNISVSEKDNATEDVTMDENVCEDKTEEESDIAGILRNEKINSAHDTIKEDLDVEKKEKQDELDFADDKNKEKSDKDDKQEQFEISENKNKEELDKNEDDNQEQLERAEYKNKGKLHENQEEFEVSEDKSKESDNNEDENNECEVTVNRLDVDEDKHQNEAEVSENVNKAESDEDKCDEDSAIFEDILDVDEGKNKDESEFTENVSKIESNDLEINGKSEVTENITKAESDKAENNNDSDMHYSEHNMETAMPTLHSNIVTPSTTSEDTNSEIPMPSNSSSGSIFISSLPTHESNNVPSSDYGIKSSTSSASTNFQKSSSSSSSENRCNNIFEKFSLPGSLEEDSCLSATKDDRNRVKIMTTVEDDDEGEERLSSQIISETVQQAVKNTSTFSQDVEKTTGVTSDENSNTCNTNLVDKESNMQSQNKIATPVKELDNLADSAMVSNKDGDVNEEKKSNISQGEKNTAEIRDQPITTSENTLITIGDSTAKRKEVEKTNDVELDKKDSADKIHSRPQRRKVNKVQNDNSKESRTTRTLPRKTYLSSQFHATRQKVSNLFRKKDQPSASNDSENLNNQQASVDTEPTPVKTSNINTSANSQKLSKSKLGKNSQAEEASQSEEFSQSVEPTIETKPSIISRITKALTSGKRMLPSTSTSRKNSTPTSLIVKLKSKRPGARKAPEVDEKEDREREKSGETRSHKCDVCDRMFTGPMRLKRHQLHHQAGRHFCCDVCGKSFMDQEKLDFHQQVHTQSVNGVYVCKICNQGCRGWRNFIYHTSTHGTDKGKRYSCEVCGHSLSTAGRLQRHSLHHKKGLHHCCHWCGKLFRTPDDLATHSLKHSTPSRKATISAMLPASSPLLKSETDSVLKKGGFQRASPTATKRTAGEDVNDQPVVKRRSVEKITVSNLNEKVDKSLGWESEENSTSRDEEMASDVSRSMPSTPSSVQDGAEGSVRKSLRKKSHSRKCSCCPSSPVSHKRTFNTHTSGKKLTQHGHFVSPDKKRPLATDAAEIERKRMKIEKIVKRVKGEKCKDASSESVSEKIMLKMEKENDCEEEKKEESPWQDISFRKCSIKLQRSTSTSPHQISPERVLSHVPKPDAPRAAIDNIKDSSQSEILKKSKGKSDIGSENLPTGGKSSPVQSASYTKLRSVSDKQKSKTSSPVEGRQLRIHRTASEKMLPKNLAERGRKKEEKMSTKIETKAPKSSPKTPTTLAFSCNICRKSFRTDTDMKIHVSQHLLKTSPKQAVDIESVAQSCRLSYEHGSAGKPGYVCHRCGFNAQGYAEFTKHMWIHSPKPHQCSECCLAFKLPETLQSHMKLHAKK